MMMESVLSFFHQKNGGAFEEHKNELHMYIFSQHKIAVEDLVRSSLASLPTRLLLINVTNPTPDTLHSFVTLGKFLQITDF